MEKYLIFDLGGTTIKYAKLYSDGTIIEKYESFKTECDDYEKLLNDILIRIKEHNDIKGIGLSVPGVVDSTGYIERFPGEITCMLNKNIKLDLENKLNLNVFVEQDANCAALAEVWKGNASDINNSVFIVLGTGIGGAVVIDKKIVKGHHLLNGEFGFMIMNFDVESKTFIPWSFLDGSVIGLVNRVNDQKGLNDNPLSGKEIFELADSGDDICKKELDRFFTQLSVAIFNIQATIDPEAIIIGGGISEREDLVSRIYKYIDIIQSRGVLFDKIDIRACKYNNDANLIGALYHITSNN